MGNAETAHSLLHWRISLNFYVLDWLRNNGHLRAEKIVERESWNTKKREKYSNSVVDGMEASGEMRNLYREFKENLEAARSAKVSFAGISDCMDRLTILLAREILIWESVTRTGLSGPGFLNCVDSVRGNGASDGERAHFVCHDYDIRSKEAARSFNEERRP